MVAVALLLVLAVLGIVCFARHGRTEDRAGFLRRAGFGVLAFLTGFFLLFAVGETVADPGGWAAAGLIALWLVPLVGLLWLSWYQPDLAVRALAVLTGLLLAATVWATVASHGWRAFEDDHGPVRTIATFVLVAAAGLLGLRRTRAAGLLLIVLGVGPVLIASAGDATRGSLAAVSSPALLAGLLYLASAAVERRGGRTEPIGYGPPGGFDGAANQRHHAGGR